MLHSPTRSVKGCGSMAGLMARTSPSSTDGRWVRSISSPSSRPNWSGSRWEVIFATNTPAVVAVKQTGTKIPVVFAAVSEPIEIGAVASLARPGGNFTGLTTSGRELMPKRLELLKEAIPQLTRVGYLANPTYAVHQPQLHEMQAAARSLGMELHPFEVRGGV